jgi:hypothetical protein
MSSDVDHLLWIRIFLPSRLHDTGALYLSSVGNTVPALYSILSLLATSHTPVEHVICRLMSRRILILQVLLLLQTGRRLLESVFVTRFNTQRRMSVAHVLLSTCLSTAHSLSSSFLLSFSLSLSLSLEFSSVPSLVGCPCLLSVSLLVLSLSICRHRILWLPLDRDHIRVPV